MININDQMISDIMENLITSRSSLLVHDLC